MAKSLSRTTRTSLLSGQSTASAPPTSLGPVSPSAGDSSAASEPVQVASQAPMLRPSLIRRGVRLPLRLQNGLVPATAEQQRREALRRQIEADAEFERQEAAKRAPQPSVSPVAAPPAPATVPAPVAPPPAPVAAPAAVAVAPTSAIGQARNNLLSRGISSMEKKYGFRAGFVPVGASAAGGSASAGAPMPTSAGPTDSPFVVAPPGVPKKGDHIPAMLEHDEAVLPGKTVQAIGKENLVRIIKNTNDGKKPKIGARGGGKYDVGLVPDDDPNLYAKALQASPANPQIMALHQKEAERLKFNTAFRSGGATREAARLIGGLPESPAAATTVPAPAVRPPAVVQPAPAVQAPPAPAATPAVVPANTIRNLGFGVTRTNAPGRTIEYSNIDPATGQARAYAAPYTAADGTPTSDWFKTQTYAEGVKRAQKDIYDAAALDIGEAARTRSGAEGERQKQAAIAQVNLGVNGWSALQKRAQEAAAAKQGLDAGNVQLATANMSLKQQQRLQSLYDAYDKAAPEQRAGIAEQIRVMTGKEAKQNLHSIDFDTGQMNDRGEPIYKRGLVHVGPDGKVSMVGPGQSGQATTSAPKVGETRNGYRFKGGNPADKTRWEKV